MIALFFKALLILCCLCMLVLKREYKPAVFIFGYTVLSAVSLPVPMGNTVYFLPIFYIVTEGIQIKSMIQSFKIRELVLALVVFAISFLYNYANSPHYWGSASKFVTLLFRECITTYFIIIVGFFSVKNIKTFRPFLQVAFISLIIITLFGIVNYLTRESSMLDWILGSSAQDEMSVGRKFTEAYRFRTQSLFVQPFDYGYICLVILLAHMYGYTRHLVSKKRLIAVFLMAMFGVLTCACRTVVACFIFGFMAFMSLHLKGDRAPIIVGVFILATLLLYEFSPFIQSKLDFFMSIFAHSNSQFGGSSMELRMEQLASVLSYMDGHYWLGRGYDFFWIDLQFSKGLENSLAPELYGLEGVHLSYLLERGIVGYALYLLFFILLLSFILRHRKSNREEAAAAFALLVMYLSFAHMTGELNSPPSTFLLLGMLLRTIQNESWKWVRYQRKSFTAHVRHRPGQLS